MRIIFMFLFILINFSIHFMLNERNLKIDPFISKHIGDLLLFITDYPTFRKELQFCF